MDRRHGLELGVIALLLWGCAASPAAAPAATRPAVTYRNPVLEANQRPADPHVIRYQGKYYLYPTLDSRSYDVFVSDDLVHWEPKGKCFRDARGGVWAPDVFHHAGPKGDGKFYLYYTVDAPRKGGAKEVGVAVADGPLGPFVDRGVLADSSIDAHLFADEDGKLYLYYVQLPAFKIHVQPMADPLTKTGEARVVIQPTEPWEKIGGNITEGPWMVKRNGTYYLMYSGSPADRANYAIGYATARSPLGPFVKHAGNPIAQRGEGVFGPGHHCVVSGPDGRLWMVYHQKADDQQNWKRFVCIDPLWFDEQGVMRAKVTRGSVEQGP